MDLILASTSQYRREQLERLGLSFRCVAPSVDEDAIKRELGPDTHATAIAERLAIAKAANVAAKERDAVVIGGDQIVALGNRILSKPVTFDRAIEQLLALSGNEHQLISAIAVADRSGVEVYTEVIRMNMRVLDRAEASRYVEADRPVDCAGSYKIESRGIALFDRIEGGDHSAIVGMPLIALTNLLRSRGFRIP